MTINGKGCMWQVFGCAGIGVLMCLGMIIAYCAGTCSEFGVNADSDFVEKRLSGDRLANHKIGVLTLSGVITASGNTFDESVCANEIVEQISLFENDEKICGLLVHLDTPGGEVTASDEIYEALCSFRDRTGKPIVAYGSSMAASGGYYIACAADSFIVHRTCLTGSVGVIMAGYHYYDLMKKLGIGSVTFKSGRLKDALNPERTSTPEELALFEHSVQSVFDEFVDVVCGGRGLKEEVVRASPIGDGRVILGKDAVGLGLADAAGYYEDAVETLYQLSGLADDASVQFVSYQRSFKLEDMLMSFGAGANKPNLQLKVPGIPGAELSRGRLYYLMPGTVQ